MKPGVVQPGRGHCVGMHTSDLPLSGDLPTPAGCGGPAPSHQVLVFTPRTLNDARSVLIAVRDRRTVVVNAAWLEDAPGQRLIDFVCGGLAALDGQALRIAEEIFLFAPRSAKVTEE